MNRDALLARLEIHEGLKLKPYHCPAGKLTIGIGRNLDDVGISATEARALCLNDIAECERHLDALCRWWRTLDETRQQILAEMCFNVGPSRLMSFVKMLAALQSYDYQKAADEMKDSAWFKQVGNRAKTLEAAMRSGQFLRTEA